jgi:hypothetical protein
MPHLEGCYRRGSKAALCNIRAPASRHRVGTDVSTGVLESGRRALVGSSGHADVVPLAVGGSNVALDAEVPRAEREKDKHVIAKVAHGKRTAFHVSYTFSPTRVNPRGRMGPRLLKVGACWLAGGA